MKKLTLRDATKEELLQYFFSCYGCGGGFVIPMDKERFLWWLQQKRKDELRNAQEASMDASQKSLKEYIEYLKQANDEKDIERKLELLKKADKAYKRYENYNNKTDKLDDKIKDAMDLLKGAKYEM